MQHLLPYAGEGPEIGLDYGFRFTGFVVHEPPTLARRLAAFRDACARRFALAVQQTKSAALGNGRQFPSLRLPLRFDRPQRSVTRSTEHTTQRRRVVLTLALTSRPTQWAHLPARAVAAIRDGLQRHPLTVQVPVLLVATGFVILSPDALRANRHKRSCRRAAADHRLDRRAARARKRRSLWRIRTLARLSR